LLVLRQEDLLTLRRETVRRVFGFLGVDDEFWSSGMEHRFNVSGAKGRRARIAGMLRRSRLARPARKLPVGVGWRLDRLTRSRRGPTRPQMDDAVRQRVRTWLEPEIAGLEELTGWDLSSWRERAPVRSGA